MYCMKTLGINQMEVIQGGDEWHYSWNQHVGCALIGVITLCTVAASWAAPGAYLACLLVAY